MATTDTNTYPGAGILTESIVSLFNWAPPQYWNKIAARFGVQFDGIYQALAVMGREEAVAADIWYAYEENRYNRSITAYSVSTTTPGAGGAVTVTLPSGEHWNSGKVSFPRDGDIVMTVDEIPCLVYNKSTTVDSAHTITIKPLDATDDIGNITSEKLIIISGAHAAGTGQPDGTVVGATKRTFYAQILKETVGQEGTQFVNEKWFKAVDDGRSVDGWYNPGLGRAEYFLNRKIDGAFTWGKANTNSITATTDRGSVNTIYTTQGLVPWISAQGKEMSITSGAFDMADLDEVTLYLKQQGIVAPVAMFFVGAQLAQDVRNATQAYIDGNGTDYTRIVDTMFGGNAERAMAVNFKAIGLGDMTYMLKEVPAWSDPTAYAETGFNMGKYGIIMPIDSYKDPKQGVILQNLSARYRALGAYSRKFEVWNVSGAGGGAYKPYVTDVDEAMLYLRTHMGLQALKMNQGVIMRGS